MAAPRRQAEDAPLNGKEAPVTSTPHDDPSRHEHAPHPSVTEARQGITTQHIRWVLAISLTLATVAIVAAWIWISTTH